MLQSVLYQAYLLTLQTKITVRNDPYDTRLCYSVCWMVNCGWSCWLSTSLDGVSHSLHSVRACRCCVIFWKTNISQGSVATECRRLLYCLYHFNNSGCNPTSIWSDRNVTDISDVVFSSQSSILHQYFSHSRWYLQLIINNVIVDIFVYLSLDQISFVTRSKICTCCCCCEWRWWLRSGVVWSLTRYSTKLLYVGPG